MKEQYYICTITAGMLNEQITITTHPDTLKNVQDEVCKFVEGIESECVTISNISYKPVYLTRRYRYDKKTL